MIVRCENCQTEFALADSQVPPDGVSVRCSVCAHVFRVSKPDGGADQPWQIRTTDDLLFSAPDLGTLREWIQQARLHPDDEVSRTGHAWLRIGDMPELAALFDGYEDLPQVVTPMGGADAAHSTGAEAAVQAADLGPPPEFGTSDSEPEAVSQPAPAPSAGAAAAELPAHEPMAPPPEPATVPSGVGSSMLHAVSEHAVKPITRAAPEPSPESAPEPALAPEPDPAPAPEPRRSEAPVRVDAMGVEEDDDFHQPARRRRALPIVAAVLGVGAAVGLVFGWPQIRALVLPQAEAPPVAPSERLPEIEQAAIALGTLGAADLARAEAALQRVLDTGEATPEQEASLLLAQSDLLVCRSLVTTMASAVAAEPDQARLDHAADDLQRAGQIFDGIQAGTQGELKAVVRARLRLAQGRDKAEILALLPERGHEETRLAVEAASLWRDPDAPVPPNVISSVRALEKPTGLSAGVLLLALLRSGDEVEARNEAERILVKVPDHPVALAIQARLGGGEGEDTDGEGGDAAGADTDGEGSAEGGADGKKGKKGGGKNRFEALLNKGCKQVETGSASAGVSTLLKAFDLKPTNLDVLVCLGQGYAQMKNHSRALHFYGKALSVQPSHRAALKGAAKSAAKSGNKAKAIKYYEKLLAAEPSNSEAKEYLAKQGGGSEPKPAPEGAGPASTPPGPKGPQEAGGEPPAPKGGSEGG